MNLFCFDLRSWFDFNFMFSPIIRLLPCCPVSQKISGSPPPRRSSSGAGTSPGVENEETWWQPSWSVRSPFIDWIMIRTMVEMIVWRSSLLNRLHFIQNLKHRKPHVTPTIGPPHNKSSNNETMIMMITATITHLTALLISKSLASCECVESLIVSTHLGVNISTISLISMKSLMSSISMMSFISMISMIRVIIWSLSTWGRTANKIVRKYLWINVSYFKHPFLEWGRVVWTS